MLSFLFKRKNPPPPPEPQKNRWLPVGVVLICSFCVYLIVDSLSPHLPVYNEPPRLYSNQCQKDLRLTLLEAIRKSTESIHLVMFGLTDPAILKAVGERARKGMPVNLYYDPKGTYKIQKYFSHAHLHPVSNTGLMHQKILVLDQEMVFIGSANMTTASLRMHDNLVIGFMSPKIAKFLQEKTPYSSGYMRSTVGGQDVEIWLLPDPRGHALNDLRKKIRAAHHSIRIALFTYTHPALIEEVIAAHKRGVEVSIVIDMHSGLGASAKGIQQLKEEGVKVSMSQGMQLMHHKFIWIDEKTLLTGSANWTKAAFYKNSDCFIALNNLTSDQKSFMKKLWRRLETEAKRL
ncbi:MAG: hypothetical protein JSS32_05435 [Verrucomicrobia bacterium]|nr:hypothetical protein [Verrucomicrobiota bacterium]